MAINTTFTSGQILTAAQMNNLPWGIAGSVARTTSVSALTSSVADITGVSVTFTAVSTRVYKFTFAITGQKISTDGWTAIQLTDSANTQYIEIDQFAPAGSYWNCSGACFKTGLTGSVTVKLRGLCQSNTSNITVGATAPIILIVEDIGAA
jgi:hypothetical protein